MAVHLAWHVAVSWRGVERTDPATVVVNYALRPQQLRCVRSRSVRSGRAHDWREIPRAEDRVAFCAQLWRHAPKRQRIPVDGIVAVLLAVLLLVFAITARGVAVATVRLHGVVGAYVVVRNKGAQDVEGGVKLQRPVTKIVGDDDKEVCASVVYFVC